jgi:hypothetical protein
MPDMHHIAHRERENAPGHDGQASRYRLRWMTCRAQRRRCGIPTSVGS